MAAATIGKRKHLYTSPVHKPPTLYNFGGAVKMAKNEWVEEEDDDGDDDWDDDSDDDDSDKGDDEEW